MMRLCGRGAWWLTCMTVRGAGSVVKFLHSHRDEIGSAALATASAGAGAIKGSGLLLYDLASLRLYSAGKLEQVRCRIERQASDFARLSGEGQLDVLAVGGELVADMVRSGKVPADVQMAYEAAYPHLAERMDFAAAAAAKHGEELTGLVSGVKGKLFEMRYVDYLNEGHLPDGYTAHLAQWSTQPGWDVAVTGPDDQVSQLLQLKASDSVSYVKNAIGLYPDIDVVTTEEVYSRLVLHGAAGDVANSGISDAALHDHVAGAADLAHPHADLTPPVIALALIAFTTYRREDLDGYQKARQFGERGVRSYLTYLLGGSVAALTQTWWLGILTGMGARYTAGRGRKQREAYRHLQQVVQCNDRILRQLALPQGGISQRSMWGPWR